MKTKCKTTLAYSLAALIIFSGALGGCEPLTDHEKEMRSIEKEIKKSKKAVKRLQRQIPDLDKLENQFDREGLESAMNRTDWKGAKMYYERLLKRGAILGDYPQTLETRMLELASITTALHKPKTILSPGTRLSRDWQGNTYVVDVLDKGYAFDGKLYSSLTPIAKTITGSHRSGPYFFGVSS